MVSAIVRSLCVEKHLNQSKSAAALQMMVHPKNSQWIQVLPGLKALIICLKIVHELWFWDVSPQQLSELPVCIAEKTENCLILSIMAGITLNRLQQSFPKAKNIVRSMPNTDKTEKEQQDIFS